MTELTDRMRTCAAYLLSAKEVLVGTDMCVTDAVELLIEASNALETATAAPEKVPEDLGEPMEIIQPRKGAIPPPVMGGSLPHHPRACPHCGAHAANTVRRDGSKLMLACPACGKEWQFKPKAEWT
jgi:hypothetical protein